MNKAFQGAHGWYVGVERDDGSHRQPSFPHWCSETEARREARRLNDRAKGQPTAQDWERAYALARWPTELLKRAAAYRAHGDHAAAGLLEKDAAGIINGRRREIAEEIAAWRTHVLPRIHVATVQL